MSWKLEDWESTIRKIIDETNQARKASGKRKILDDWRAELEKEPTLLQPFRIDVIVREVQRRLKSERK